MILAQPFPAYTPSENCLRSPIISGFIVFLIIVLFKPFGLSRVTSPYFPAHALLYGLGTATTIIFNSWLIPKLFPAWFEEKGWTVGKELLLVGGHVLTINLVNIAVTRLLYGGSFSWQALINFLGYTLAVSIFPITCVILLKYVVLLQKNQVVVTQIKQELNENKPNASPQSPLIKLTGEYQQEVLEIPLNSIYFLSAADNYIKVYYLEKDKLVFRFLRSTLKKAEGVLHDYPQFFRCHRTYLVNLKQIQQVTGNAQGLKLHLLDTDEVIPVSRSLNQELTNRLQQQNKLTPEP